MSSVTPSRILPYIMKKHIHSSKVLYHGEYERQPPKSDDEIVNIHVIDRDHIQTDIKGKVGDNVMFLCQMHEVEVEGACEASLACCTCHVYVDAPFFDLLDEMGEEEEDLLDMAPFLQENSRLSCQVLLRKDMEGMTVRLPHGTRNFKPDKQTTTEGAT